MKTRPGGGERQPNELMSSIYERQSLTQVSPRFLARMLFVLGFVEGVASVNGQLRIPGRLVVDANAAVTSANILANESLFRLGLALCLVAVVCNIARTALLYVLFRPVGRIAVLLTAFFSLIAIALQAGGSLVQLPVLILLKSGRDFSGLNADQINSIALLFLRWSGQAFNLYLAFFGFCCILVGALVYRSTFLPKVLGVLEVAAGIGYATYFWPPLANTLFPYNLALGLGEIALGLWFLIFGVNVGRWKAQAARTTPGLTG